MYEERKRWSCGLGEESIVAQAEVTFSASMLVGGNDRAISRVILRRLTLRVHRS